MRRGKSSLLAIVAAALVLAGGLIWWLFGRTPPVPPHPLSTVTPESVVSAFAGAEPLARNSAAFRAAAALPARLVSIPPLEARPINWAMARSLRLTTSAGLLVWLQLADQAGSTWVRVNADPLPGSGQAAQRQARAIRQLRLKAYRIGGPAESAQRSPHG